MMRDPLTAKTVKNNFFIYEEFQVEPQSFALAQVQQHGTPYVLLVDRQAKILRSDRRPGWRELLDSIAATLDDELPRELARVLKQHITTPPVSDAATVAVVGDGVIVSITSFDGAGDFYACCIWRFERASALTDASRRYGLTKREAELLDCVLQGQSSAQIARSLSISLATVEWHTKRLLSKTDACSRTQMAMRAVGWLPDSTQH